MKRIYLTGSVDTVKDYFKYSAQDILVLSDVVAKLSKTVTPQQAMTIKVKDIRACDLVVCALPSKYYLNAEDMFTLSFAAGLGKQLAFIGNTKEKSSYMVYFKAFNYLVFEDISELLEYIRLDSR